MTETSGAGVMATPWTRTSLKVSAVQALKMIKRASYPTM